MKTKTDYDPAPPSRFGDLADNEENNEVYGEDEECYVSSLDLRNKNPEATKAMIAYFNRTYNQRFKDLFITPDDDGITFSSKTPDTMSRVKNDLVNQFRVQKLSPRKPLQRGFVLGGRS